MSDVPPPVSGLALRYAQAIPVLMKACGIAPSARTAFDARIRQLQRLGLPQRDPSRTAGPFGYGIVELAALATAVRLMAAFMVPSLAARYVTEQWTILAPALLAGARAALPKEYTARRLLDGRTFIVFEASALAELGLQGRHDERYVGTLGAMVVLEEATLPASIKELGGAGLVLDTTMFMPLIVNEFAIASIATEQELAHELDRLRYGG